MSQYGPRREGGFTLLEVVVAGTILTISSLALASTLAQTSGLAAAPREEAAAHHAVRSASAVLAATPFDQVAALHHGRNFPVPGLTVRKKDADGMCGRVTFDYGPDGDTSFYTVTIRVEWTGRIGDRAIESVHYLANVRGDVGTPTPLEELGTVSVEPPVDGEASPQDDPLYGGTAFGEPQ